MREARRSLLVAAVLGQVAAWLAGVLPLLVLPVSAALLVALALIGARASERRAVQLRRAGGLLALVATLVALPRVLGSADGGLREVLGPLLVAVQIAQAVSWRTRRELQTGLLVAGGLLVLGASFAPDVLVGLPLVAGWAACLLTLVRLQALPTATATATSVQGGRPAASRLPVLVPALGLAMALVAFLLIPVSDGGGALAQRLSAAARGPQALTGRASVFGGGGVDLRTRGTLSEQVLAEVEDRTAPLWRSGSYDSWDGAVWSATPAARGVVPEQRLTGPPFVLPGAPTGQTRRDQVRLSGPRGPVWSPGLATSVQAAAPIAGLDESGALYLPRETRSYVVDSVPLETSPDVLRTAAAGPPDPRYLQLPDALPDRVRTLAREITADAPTTYDKVVAVERWLAANATYRLDSPVPGPGEDAVDRFLFVDRTGFCEQFAAAEAVLLRAVGIPTRFVVGLAYGEPGGNGRRVFRESMLHAWVEVAYEGVGWSPSDPTADAAQAAVTTSLRTRLSAVLAGQLRAVDRLPGGRPAAAVVVLGVLVGATGLARRRRVTGRATIEKSAPDTVMGSPLLQAFSKWDGRLGERRRRRGESIAEMRVRVTPTEAEGAALAVVEQHCYAEKAPPPEAAEKAASALRS